MYNLLKALVSLLLFSLASALSQEYKVVDTGQVLCFDTLSVITCPMPEESFYGQDSQFEGAGFTFSDNGDGTVTDLNTGLMWQKSLLSGKLKYSDALAAADTFSLAGYDDWRLPSIKELYSLIDFRGLTSTSALTSIPFIDTNYFQFRYGDSSSGERFIDAQYISSTEYTGTTMNGEFTVFGVNFADGRIKGYPAGLSPMGYKLFEVRYVRGNTNYGLNSYTDNNDSTITDNSTGLMWSKYDNGEGLNWQTALDWVQQKNSENYLGYNDWRLPNAKELQSIVDYSRSVQSTISAAIDPLFDVTVITDEGGNINYPFYWTGTTHADGNPLNQYQKAVYVAFGEGLGFMEVPPNSGNYVLMDVHGAGSQRSDPKSGDPNNFPHGFGPQGDVIRIYNFVRPVRDVMSSEVSESDLSYANYYRLEQNYPNPFNPTTMIKFTIPSLTKKSGSNLISFVTLKVYDLLGKELLTLLSENLSPGEYNIRFDGSELTSGLYFYRLETNDFVHTRKMILLR